MMFLIGLIIYVICVYSGVKFTVYGNLDKEKILNWKEKSLFLVWFTFFISSQMMMINQVLMWIGLV